MYPDTAIWLVLHSITFISKPYLHGAQLRACLASADRIIVNSHFLKDQVIRKVPQAAGKIRVNHLGTDPDQFIPRWTELGMVRRQMDLHRAGLEDKKIVMFVGRLIRIKGVHLLLKAWPNIIKQVPNAVLLIVGSAFYGSKRLTPYVKRLHYYGNKMRRHVRFVPYIPHSEIQNWFRMADVLVVPSSVKEAFGLVNVEAMASGVPVVATRAGGMKEIIEHGRTGYLIKASNLQDELAPRIVSLLTDPGLVEAMGMESVRRVEEHFTWARTAERLLEMYKHET
jgi:spore coat protein SA